MRTIISAIAVLLLSACGSPSNTTATATGTDATPSLAVGKTGIANGVEITLTSVKQTNQVMSAKLVPLAGPQETYVVVKYTIKNTGSAPLAAMSHPELDLADPNGQVYSKDDMTTALVGAMQDAQSMASDINPGITIKSAAVWKVAKQSFDLGTWKVVARTDPALEFKLK